ncbi:MAG: chemotaxis response regulator protein-glutamate methylesterase [Caldilineae bacterium]|nr:MAG: chemotaxis response regulator protein-glutamate methylesterase [Caldilineae bacterium]
MSIKLQVLVVDDSALMRRLIGELLESDPGIEVVGTARDGMEAVEKVLELRPDVVTMDVEMPRMNGLDALSQIMQRFPVPVVMLTGLTEAEVALEAMERGAVDFVLKPSGTISMDLHEIRDELVHKVKLARLANLRKLSSPVLPAPSVPSYGRRRVRSKHPAVVIGASTGGPRAVESVLAALPGDLPAPVLIVQHMPPGFTRSFAQRLDQRSALAVKEAEGGEALEPGNAFVAPGDFHLRVQAAGSAGRVKLEQSPPVNGVRPAVDVTMKDVAEVYGRGAVGVVLTGMGADGAQGAQHIRAAGGIVIAQDQESCVVFGMPRAVIRAGAADRVLPLEDIPAAIVQALAKNREVQP